jgi:nucleotide-binding universal stress UspA family protein
MNATLAIDVVRSQENAMPVPATHLREVARLQTIVVPTDFSPSSRRALEWAIALASRHQARIVLVHAMQPHPLGGTPDVDRMLNEAATLKLEETKRPIIDAHLSMSTDCRAGKSWAVIRDAVQEAKADLIVIGSRGLTGLDRLLLGSTADRVLRTAAQPVLTVHPTDARPAYRHVLVATDFSDSAHAALAATLQLLQADTQPLQITLLHVSIPPYVIGSLEVPVTLMPDWNAIDRDTRQNLESLAASIRSQRVQVITDVVRGYPASVILEEARSRHVDLIALGTRGATGLDRFFLGSTAERVIHHAPCPVLTAHAPVTAKERSSNEATAATSRSRKTSFASA